MKNALLTITGAYATGGGIAAVNRMVIRALLEFGYSLQIFSLNEAIAIASGHIPESLKEYYHTFNGDKQAFTFAVWKAMAVCSNDLVLVDHVNLASILAPMALARRCNYLVWLFGIEVFPPRPSMEGILGMRYAHQRLAISMYTRQRVLERFPNLSIATCELALDPDRHTPLVDPVETSADGHLCLTALDGSSQAIGDAMILHVGRMEPQERYKGQDVLLRAFPRIRAVHPASQLVLVGEGLDAPRLMALARSLAPDLLSAIFMPGYVANDLLGQLYQSCSLFAMPSMGEGFGLVYLEAMARAKPCIGGRLDAARCVIRDGETGLLVDNPRSVEQVADNVSRLLGEPQMARQMGLAGYKIVRDHYLFSHFKERFAIAASL